MPFIISSLCQYFIRKFAAPRIGETFVETKIIHLLKFRIPEMKHDTEVLITNAVNHIIKMKKLNKDTSEFEKQLDVSVYKLYNLTYTEVKIVDPDFWLSEAEYENHKPV